jgi:hypothetical protein
MGREDGTDRAQMGIDAERQPGQNRAHALLLSKRNTPIPRQTSSYILHIERSETPSHTSYLSRFSFNEGKYFYLFFANREAAWNKGVTNVHL